MIKINKKNKAKNKIFEFLTVFSMTFGIVVGTGIYMKNSNEPGGVLGEAGGNPYLALSVWVFIGTLCTLMMITFIEAASSSKDTEHATPQSWTNKFVGRKTASLFSLVYICMYLPVLASIGALFIVRTFFGFLDDLYFSLNKTHMYTQMGDAGWLSMQVIISTLVLLIFQFANIYTKKPGKWIQTICTFTKFIPLLVAILGGLVVAITSSDPNSFNPSPETEINPWGISPFFAAMIPILYAFDGFIYAATLQKDFEHKEVVAPGMLAGIVAITLFYMLVTVSIFFAREDGNIYNLFESIINNPWGLFAFRMIIVITLLTMVNGYTTLLPVTIHSAFEEGFLFSKSKGQDYSFVKCGWISNIITWIVFLTFVSTSLIVTSLTNVNSITDASGNIIAWNGGTKVDYYLVANYSSNSTIMFAFIIYYVIMIGVLHNRKTNKVDTRKIKGGYVTGIISLSMMTVALGYTYIDFFIFKFMNEDKQKMIDPLLLILFAIVIITWWIINECLLSKQDIKNNDFYLRIQPKNWFKYNKEEAIKKYENKLK